MIPATRTKPAKRKNSFACFSTNLASATINTMTLPNETVSSQTLASTDFMEGGAYNKQ